MLFWIISYYTFFTHITLHKIDFPSVENGDT